MSNLTLHTYDEPRPEMDELLSDYFQSEMPKPWPSFKAPKPMTRPTPSLWSRYGGRFALAACITVLVAGYWSLSGAVPQGNAPHGMEHVGDRVGMGHGKTKAPDVKQDGANQQLVPMGTSIRPK
jgi:hypothetical protein